MYVPTIFKAEALEEIQTLARDFPFATLTAVLEGRAFTAHVPLLLRSEPGRPLILSGHVANENPFSERLDGELLVEFIGPNVYIPPEWYTQVQHYPTWWSAIVQCRGIAKRLPCTDLSEHLRQLISEYQEKFVGSNWSIEVMPVGLTEHLMKFIVPFEIEVQEIVCSLRVGQNKAPQEIASIAERLRASGRADWIYIAALAERQNAQVNPEDMHATKVKYSPPDIFPISELSK